MNSETIAGAPNPSTGRSGHFRQMPSGYRAFFPANARFVPPPAEELAGGLVEFERYMNTARQLPPLVQCALLHYQFETLHPFNDGNGRVGRLLITLYLVSQGVLEQPVLYLSAHLKIHQQEYYDRLQKSRGTATKLVNLAERLGVIKQISQGRRNRKYAYSEYVAILSEDTELN